MSKITINEIAKLAGVGKSTVSRYLNNGYVKEENRQKIKAIIEKYNYEPNSFAQSLKAKYSKMIGIIAPCLDSTVSSRIMMKVDETLRAQGYFPIITNTNHDAELEIRSIENLANMKVDGIILLATSFSQKHHQLFEKLNIPLLIVAQDHPNMNCIINDDYLAGYKVGQIVGSKKFKDVIYLGVSENDEAVGKIRKKGVKDGLLAHGISQLDTFITDFDYEHAFITIDRILDIRIPEIIICATDKIALGAYKAIIKKGLKIPDDVSLIGFGGYELSQLITPRLTTIRFESEKSGALAAETIIKMIKQEPVVQKQIIGFEIIEGNSIK